MMTAEIFKAYAHGAVDIAFTLLISSFAVSLIIGALRIKFFVETHETTKVKK